MKKVIQKAVQTVKDMFKALKMRGDYAKISAWMRKKQVYTKSMIIAELMTYGKTASTAKDTAGVMLSPRESSKLGDGLGRGNFSCPWGHLAYNKKLIRKVVKGAKEEQKYKFTYRSEALAPNKRKAKDSVASEKVATKAKAKVATKTKAKATKVKAKAKKAK